MTLSNSQLKTPKIELSKRIKDKAMALGFDKVGIVSPDVFNTEPELLKNWLDNGYQAEMGWMVNHFDKRIDPASLMEDTKAIVCVLMNYYTEDPINPAPDTVKIAKYARGTDYHHVLKKRLKQLLAELQEDFPELRGRAVTDSAPIMEKPLAQKAGLGWIGKNGNLITPDKGSFLFLGELLLNVELETDLPFENFMCGTCTRCIDACPTDAIVNDGVIDANRCISYWTIEHKGDDIPKEIAQNMAGWVFGCDICQDVCPWNIKFSTETTEAEFQPRPWNVAPKASDLLALDQETFNDHYRKSPIKRTKLASLLRNVNAVFIN